MTAAASHLTVAICVGKSCRRRDEHGPLCEELSGSDADVVRVTCMGVCRGPVVVLQPGSDDAVVLQRVRGRKARQKLSTLSQWPTKLPRRLREREVSGGTRIKAVVRARRSIERRSRRDH